MSINSRTIISGRYLLISNPDQKNIKIGKAGRSRWLGVRPQTRGIAMNPVDHPHGGRTNGGRHPVTPWGIKTKGKKTRKNKKQFHSNTIHKILLR